MENTGGVFHYQYRFVFLVIILLLVTPALSTAVTKKETPHLIQIPLKLIGKPDCNEHGWKVVRFQNKPANKIIPDKDGLHIKVDYSVNLLAYYLSEPVEVNGILL
jgi:hypothetical protein